MVCSVLLGLALMAGATVLTFWLEPALMGKNLNLFSW